MNYLIDWSIEADSPEEATRQFCAFMRAFMDGPDVMTLNWIETDVRDGNVPKNPRIDLRATTNEKPVASL
jgi:hypothetical protein